LDDISMKTADTRHISARHVLGDPMRQRADIALVERGLFPSRARARAAIEAGLVLVNGVALKKPADPIDSDARIEASAPHPWVSRGGLKLEAGLDFFGFDPTGMTCLDVGASTGGFTDVLLARGAAKVYAIDVGRGQLHASLRANPQVISMEATDARALRTDMFDVAPRLIVCDASFISLRLALPIPLSLAAPDAGLIALIKPQFEAGRERVGKGVVRDAATHADVCDAIVEFLETSGWRVIGLTASPIEGGDGNKEFLIGARRMA
jgi:23S rRNA (cytidine1920-2'-O)/16S rRNA (cytidine1409-2'-O)-methyltransferase